MYWKQGKDLELQLWENYSVSWEWGFLPPTEPLKKIANSYFAPWEQLVENLPQLLRERKLHFEIEQLPLLDVQPLHGREEYQRALTLLSFLSSGYVWMDHMNPKKRLPSVLAIPFKQVCKYFDLPPILTYSGFTLFNWKLINPDLPFSVENITIPTTFSDTESERWFSIIPLGTEYVGAKSVQNIILAQSKIEEIVNLSQTVQRKSSQQENYESNSNEHKVNQGSEELSTPDHNHRLIEQRERELLGYLFNLNETIKAITEIVHRMYERCDPETFYDILRPYLSGWKGSALLPEGLVYEGLSDEPLQFHGSSAAQSSVFAVLDAALGVTHRPEERVQIEGTQTTQSMSGGAHNFLELMKQYMPQKHREFIARVQQSPFSIHSYIEFASVLRDELRDAFNSCIESLSNFRKAHMGLAMHYVVSRARQRGSSVRGTGGSDVISLLKKLRTETDCAKLE